MIALAALVAGAAALVYVHDEASTPNAGSSAGAVMAAAEAADQAPKALYDFNALPDPVKRMLERIATAAQSGEIENMQPVFESNELKPMVATGSVDPIALWKKESADGSGRDILAAMLNVLSSGYARVGQGADEMYVWPYFAETGVSALTPAQEVELYRTVPRDRVAEMKKSGKYSYYRLGIAPNGVWHYFLQ
ncbi:MAG TPA: hypothetical protein VFQ29_01185 [Methyloceanibacter sp.]|jgi:hypothetical protein|nr:hypothetical protein [Methyloceanibacter sp.]